MMNKKYSVVESDNGFGNCLVLKSEWNEGLRSVIEQENISVLRLSESMGWCDDNIEFLKDLQSAGLRGVEIYSWRVRDVAPLSFLPSLEFIGLQCEFTKAPIFSNFEFLSHLQLLWRPKAKSVFECEKLRRLNVINFPEIDLSNLTKMSNLDVLQLTSRKLESLTGIEKLTELTILDLADCSKLNNLSGIESCSNLRELIINNCKKISEIPNLEKLTALASFSLDNCGKIYSLLPLQYCNSIQKVSFTESTDIEDGDLDFLLNLNDLSDVRFKERPHYTKKRNEILNNENGPKNSIFSFFKK